MAKDTQYTNDDDGNGQWYFNIVTKKPELGKLSPLDQRLGPYQSRKDAEDAGKIAKKRNLKWKEQNKEWNAWDKAGQDNDDEDDEDDSDD
ncbi:hypothetical protein OZX73_03190 [Bifidobacterium sp. ESL0775]|uniref:hypothetical protein n=1 Tax=Bifidobacterium sp. ESL0775 TaxID=2983230 RepID=UPI0023F9A835|nr:hypothetical protein [Bifidobacterium sp. ESL0775]WEV69882.1 hypothetical protein OZX73_03190 [Bifidobacterium sp. ESL0775]